MDIFSHGLWAAAAARGANLKLSRKNFSPGWAAFWGVFPDLFAFTPAFLQLFWGIATGSIEPGSFPRPEDVEPPDSVHYPIFHLSHFLYHGSHSLVVFAAVFLLVQLAFRFLGSRRVSPGFVFGMFGWLLHILLDVPTHTARFYPTPVLWPISSWQFSGISWGTPGFMAANITLLLVVFWYLRKQEHS